MLKYVVLILLIGALTYVVRENNLKAGEVLELELKAERAQSEVARLQGLLQSNGIKDPGVATVNAGSPSAGNVLRAYCDACRGTGRTTRKSLTGSMQPGPCPVCAGRGTFSLSAPAGASLCDACDGIGRKKDDKALGGGARCPDCRGAGFVK